MRIKSSIADNKPTKREAEILDFVRVLGIISAGGPIEAIRDEEMVGVPRSMPPTPSHHYALKVSGVSMIIKL